MRFKFFAASLGLVVGLAMTPAVAPAATITAGPNAGTATALSPSFHVVVSINLGPAENMDLAQLAVDFNDGGTGQDIFAVQNLLGSPLGTWDFPGPPTLETPGENAVAQANTGGFMLFMPAIAGPTSVVLAEFDLVATGVVGTVNLDLFSLQSFFEVGFVTQQNFSGNIGTFTFSSVVPEPPLAALLAPALAFVALLRRRGV